VRRVLLVTQRPLRYGGGGAVRWRFLAGELPRHGWEVVELSARGNPTANEFATQPAAARLARGRAGVMGVAGRVLRAPAAALGVRPEALAPGQVWALTGRRRLRQGLRDHRPDVVVATGPPPSAYFLARGVPVPLVVEFRDLWAGNPYYDAGGGLLRRLEAGPIAAAAAVVCVTPQAAARLRELHDDLEPVVLPNGFDPELLRRRESRPPGAPATLVHAGALYGGRTLGALEAALARNELSGRVRLDVFGPGTAAGAVDAQTAADRVAAADVALVVFTPGEDTAVPGKLYEALALGKPVLALASAASAMAALLRELGQDAGLAPPDDPGAIAAALERLLARPPAPVAEAVLARFDRSRVAADYARLLDRLAG
jgi:glycosyltransferase involved in cell wall biosynthesis